MAPRGQAGWRSNNAGSFLRLKHRGVGGVHCETLQVWERQSPALTLLRSVKRVISGYVSSVDSVVASRLSLFERRGAAGPGEPTR